MVVHYNIGHVTMSANEAIYPILEIKALILSCYTNILLIAYNTYVH